MFPRHSVVDRLRMAFVIESDGLWIRTWRVASVWQFERAVSGFLMPSPTAHVVAAKKAKEKEEADCT